MSPIELADYILTHGPKKSTFAKRVGVEERTVYRWLSGAQPIPKMLVILLKHMDDAYKP